MSINRDTLLSAKDSIVAICFQNMTDKSIKFLGSGFFIKENFIITSRQIFTKFEEMASYYKWKGFIFIYHYNSNNEYVNPDILECEKILVTDAIPRSNEHDFPDNQSYGLLGIILPKIDKPLPFLEIKEKTDYKLFDEICICGYPSGEQSFDLTKKYAGLRFSPVIQFGRISSFMPTDYTPIPYGIQTDIFSTEGIIGSPIIDVQNGKAIGIIQGIIKSELNFVQVCDFFHEGKVEQKKIFCSGLTDIGLVHGMELTSHNKFAKLKESIEKGSNGSLYFVEKNLTKYYGMRLEF